MTEVSALTTKQQLFLDALTSEEAMGDLRTAMRIAGYSDNTKIAHTAKELRKEIREATETLLAMYAPRAAYALTSILDNSDTFNARHIISLRLFPYQILHARVVRSAGKYQVI